MRSTGDELELPEFRRSDIHYLHGYPPSLTGPWSNRFLAVAETGSLSAAARRLRLSQPTLGRHIRALEARLGAELFRRVARGLELTEAGAALIAPARAMAERRRPRWPGSPTAATPRWPGTVRITASTVVSHYLLPPVIARLRAGRARDADRTGALGRHREPAVPRGRHRAADVPPGPGGRRSPATSPTCRWRSTRRRTTSTGSGGPQPSTRCWRTK